MTSTQKTKVKTFTRRTPEQIIADLEQKIQRVKEREEAKAAKAKPEVRPFMTAVKAVDKAQEAAAKAGNEAMVHALETARAALGQHLIEMGMRAPVRLKRKETQEAA